ncbi:MAG: hypothetical protein IKM73_07620 [Acidaminococcaceae bacterium]|nr:hypothetical protein [Acidaminococcaceae bacterium]
MRDLLTCALGGVSFLGLDEKLYLEEIEEAPNIVVETGKRPYYGQILLNTPGVDTLTVTLTFMVKKCDRQERQDVIDKVSGWATEGYLTVGHRPGKRLYVVCTQRPKTKAFSRTERMTIIFTAYAESCWEEVTPTTLTLTGTSASTSTFKPNGTRPCFLEAEITNAGSAALTSLTLTANGKSIALSGISVAVGSKVTIAYDERHLLSIKSGSTSLLAYRTAASQDDLLLNPGVNNSVSIVTNVTCSTVLKARGMWR